jgi:multidrug transporter EmrE-like cation transporter
MKLFLVVLAAISAIVAQMNLKVVAPMLPSSFHQAINLGLGNSMWLFFRIAGISGISLLVAMICYRYLGFLEFLVAQALVYVFAIAVSYYFFHEPLYLNRIGAVVLILCGIGLFYIK